MLLEIIIVFLAAIVLLLIYELYNYSRRPRIAVTLGSKDSVESRLAELKDGVIDLREQLKKREAMLERAFGGDLDG
jgi:hypothetical protein